ncbi:MAG: hypothetical protein IKO05_03705 [Selenomonadaceae bacterium]|nr:hypothetical protein [Selenomonadaceae bacterium]
MATIYNDKSNTLVGGTNDADSIDNLGSFVTISAGGGSDTITTYGVAPTVTAYSFGKGVVIDAGSGSDSIDSSGASNSIEGGAGSDTIINTSYGMDATIKGGDGNDSIRNSARAKIYGSAGNDSLINTNLGAGASLFGNSGNDYISTYNSDGVLIDGGSDSDTIVASGTANLITVIGGTGDDLIYNAGSVVLFKYAAGDGSDIIYGFDKNSTLSIDGGYSTTKSGSDILVTVGDGKISLVGAANLSTLNIDGEKNSWTLSGTTATYGDLVVKGVKSLDGLKLNGKVLTISESSLAEKKVSISSGYTLALASDVSSPTTKGKWTLKNSTATYKRTTKAGYTLAANAKSITYSAQASATLVKVTGVESLDGLSLSGTTVTVSNASLGTSKVSITDGYKLKLGSDVNAPSTKKSWTLDGTTAAYKRTTKAGYSLSDNEIIYTKKSSKTLATVKGVNSLDALTLSGSTVKLAGDFLSSKVTVSGDYTFDFDSDFKNATVTGSASDDSIIVRGKKVLVKGGKGDDAIKLLGTGTIAGGAGNDIFQLKSTGTIGDYETGDKVSLASGAALITTDGSDVIFNGKVTLTAAKGKPVTYIENGVEKIFRTSAAVTFNAKGTSATLADTYSEDSFLTADCADFADTLITLKASAVKHSLEIFGNKNANIITGTGEDDLIDGKAGGDTISGGKGNDTLMGSAGNDSLSGGAGNDELWGGKGDDTLYGGAGSDVFIYQSGDGKDIISDYTSVDKVMVLSGKVESPFVDTDGNVTFKIGGGQLTFPNSANKYIELLDKDNNLLKNFTPTSKG